MVVGAAHRHRHRSASTVIVCTCSSPCSSSPCAPAAARQRGRARCITPGSTSPPTSTPTSSAAATTEPNVALRGVRGGQGRHRRTQAATASASPTGSCWSTPVGRARQRRLGRRDRARRRRQREPGPRTHGLRTVPPRAPVLGDALRPAPRDGRRCRSVPCRSPPIRRSRRRPEDPPAPPRRVRSQAEAGGGRRRRRTSPPCPARTGRGRDRASGSFFSRSWVTVMMSQPISAACTTLRISRGLAQISSRCSWAPEGVDGAAHDREWIPPGVGDPSGEHGHVAGRSVGEALDGGVDLVLGHDRRHVDVDALLRQRPDQLGRALAPGCW